MILTANTGTGAIDIAGERYGCASGRGGTCDAGAKREGDGRTPIGRWPIRAVLLRPDRGIAPPARVPWRWLRRSDGWSDDPDDPAYNRPVTHPHRHSAERLWRDDPLYDAIVTLGHNDAPPVPDAGSAIFLHIRAGDSTAGCIAIERPVMTRLLATLTLGDVLSIT